MTSGDTPLFDSFKNIEKGQTFTKKGSVWKEKDVRIERSAKISNAIIESGAIVDEGATVINSVIGRNCVISADSFVHHAILWKDVNLGTRAKVDFSIIAENSTILSDVKIGSRTILPHNTHLPSCTSTPDYSKFSIYMIDNPNPKPYDAEDITDSIHLGPSFFCIA